MTFDMNNNNFYMTLLLFIFYHHQAKRSVCPTFMTLSLVPIGKC